MEQEDLRKPGVRRGWSTPLRPGRSPSTQPHGPRRSVSPSGPETRTPASSPAARSMPAPSGARTPLLREATPLCDARRSPARRAQGRSGHMGCRAEDPSPRSTPGPRGCAGTASGPWVPCRARSERGPRLRRRSSPLQSASSRCEERRGAPGRSHAGPTPTRQKPRPSRS